MSLQQGEKTPNREIHFPETHEDFVQSYKGILEVVDTPIIVESKEELDAIEDSIEHHPDEEVRVLVAEEQVVTVYEGATKVNEIDIGVDEDIIGDVENELDDIDGNDDDTVTGAINELHKQINEINDILGTGGSSSGSGEDTIVERVEEMEDKIDEDLPTKDDIDEIVGGVLKIDGKPIDQYDEVNIKLP